MATVTSLGFSIFSRYDGSGVGRARRDINDLQRTIERTNGGLNNFTGRMGAAAAAAGALGPALIPITQAAAAAAAATAAMAATAGSALGIYGAAVAGAIKQADALAKSGDTNAKRYVQATNNMEKAWNQLIKSTTAETLRPAATAVEGVTAAVGKLKPVIEAVGPIAQRVANEFKNWASGSGMDRFIDTIIQHGIPALEHLVAAGKNVLSVLGTGFRAFAPEGVKVAAALERGSAALKSWADGGGFTRFIQTVQQNAPQVRQFFEALGAALKNVGTALSGLAMPSLQLATILLQIIAAMPPGLIQAIVVAWSAWRTAVMLHTAAMVAFRIVLIAVNAAIMLVRGAVIVAIAVWRLLNLAFVSTPIGAIVTAIVALVAGIVWLATQTQFFQTVWNAVWNAVKVAALAVWNALQIAWTAFINALTVAWNAVSGALVAAWNAVWTVISTVVQTYWLVISTAWTTLVNGFILVWQVVSAALVAAWNAVWMAIQLVAQTIWTALQLAWTTFITALQTIWTTVSSALTAAWNAVWTALQVAAQAIWTAIQAAWQAVCTAFTTIWNAVSGALSAAWSAFWNALQSAAQAVWSALQAAWQAFLSAVQSIWQSVSSALQSAWQAFWSAIQSAAQAVWSAIQSAWQAFLSALQSAWSAFSSALQSAWQAFWSAIQSAAQAIWTAIQAAWNAFLTAVRTAWDTFSNALRTAWEAFWNAIRTAAETVWNAIRTAWDTFLDTIRNAADTFIDGLTAAFEACWNTIRDTAERLWDAILNVIETAINAILAPINLLIDGFNAVGNVFGLDDVPNIEVNFARGGIVGPAEMSQGGALRGYSPGRDRIPAMLSPGEGVLTPEAVRGLGGPEFVHSANRKWAGHRGAGRGAPSFSKFEDRSGRRHGRFGYAMGGMAAVGASRALTMGIPRPDGRMGFPMGAITLAALARAGLAGVPITQPEYNPGVAASAGTHDGGGVIDLPPNQAYLAALLATGEWAAWMRGPEQGFAPHIHAVLMNHPDLSPAAAAQVQSFLAGGTGLGVGGGGGGGGGLLSMFAPVLEHIADIFRGIVELEPVREVIGGFLGPLANLLGLGGAPPDEEDNGGGLFGTGIGPDIGPDITPGDDLGDFVSDPLGTTTEAIGGTVRDVANTLTGGLWDSLLQMIYASVEMADLDFAFQLREEAMSGADTGSHWFGDLLHGAADWLLGGTKDYIMDNKPEMPAMAMTGVSVAGAQSVQAWAPLALQALQIAGAPASWLGAFLNLMAAESGGDPNAINRTDINAQNGIPSQGLMQVIPPTFAAYRDPALPNNILDPLANMVASINYIQARYGSVPGSPYHNGTMSATRGWHMVGERGPEMAWFGGGERVWDHRRTRQMFSRRDYSPYEHPRDKYKGDHTDGKPVLNMPITVQGNMDNQAVDKFHREVVPELRRCLERGVGRRP